MARGFFTSLARRIVRAASLLVPRRDRDAWLREWDAEIQYESRASHGLTDHLTLLQRSSGAFADAAWLRRSSRETPRCFTTRATPSACSRRNPRSR